MDHRSPPSTAETPPEKTQEAPSSSSANQKHMHAIENFKALVLKLAVASSPTKSLSFSQRSLIEQKVHQSFPHFHTPDHPPYSWMIERAIEQLNEEGGSGEKEISEYIMGEWSELPMTHVTLLRHHLRILCEKGEVIETRHGCYMLRDAAPNISSSSLSRDESSISDSLSSYSLSSSCSSESISIPRSKKKRRKRKQKKESKKKMLRLHRMGARGKKVCLKCKQLYRPCRKDKSKEEVQMTANQMEGIELLGLEAKERLSILEEPEAMEVENPLEGTDSQDNEHRPASKPELMIDIQSRRRGDSVNTELIDHEQDNENLTEGENDQAEEKQLIRELLQESRRKLGRPRKKWNKRKVVYVPKHAHRRGKRGRPRKTELLERAMQKSMGEKIEEMSIQDGNNNERNKPGEPDNVTVEELQQHKKKKIEEQQLKREEEYDLEGRKLGKPCKRSRGKPVVCAPMPAPSLTRKLGRPRKTNVSKEEIQQNVDEEMLIQDQTGVSSGPFEFDSAFGKDRNEAWEQKGIDSRNYSSTEEEEETMWWNSNLISSLQRQKEKRNKL